MLFILIKNWSFRIYNILEITHKKGLHMKAFFSLYFFKTSQCYTM